MKHQEKLSKMGKSLSKKLTGLLLAVLYACPVMWCSVQAAEFRRSCWSMLMSVSVYEPGATTFTAIWRANLSP